MIPYFVLSEIPIGFLTFKVWGLFVAFGIICATIVAAKRAKRYNLSTSFVIDLAFWLTLAAFVGGRVSYLILKKQAISEAFKLSNGGFTTLGAVICAVLVGYFILRKQKVDLRVIMDVIGPPLLLAEGVGRIGCFFLHEHLGIKTKFFLSINIFGEWRHDLAIYYSFFAICGWILLTFLSTRLTATGGFVGFLSIVWYAITRFVVDFFTEGSGEFSVAKYYGLTIAQFFSLIIIVFLVLLWVYAKQKRPTEEIPAQG